MDLVSQLLKTITNYCEGILHDLQGELTTQVRKMNTHGCMKCDRVKKTRIISETMDEIKASAGALVWMYSQRRFSALPGLMSWTGDGMFYGRKLRP